MGLVRAIPRQASRPALRLALRAAGVIQLSGAHESPRARAKLVLRVVTVVQLAAFACFVGGVILVLHVFSQTRACEIVLSPVPGFFNAPACHGSFMGPALLAAVGYATFMTSLLVRLVVRRRLRGGRSGSALRRREMAIQAVQPGGMPLGMPGSPAGPPFGMPGSPGPPLGPPPGWPGSPFGP
jgi:hypothetical protein